MNPQDADRQIEQMIAFIVQEAREKAEEIAVKTEKEFMADKLSLETQASLQIRAEHEKMKKNWAVQKKIEKSRLLSASRMTTMRARDDKINELKHEVLTKLAEVSKDNKSYSQLIRFLIAQGLMTMMEEHVTLQCRKEDLATVKKEVTEAYKLFQQVMHKSTGITPISNIVIDEKEFLPAAPVKGQTGASCSGGVLLSARNGQIVCRNTLDARLDICFEHLKPTIRGALFGVREKLVSNAPVERHAVSLPK